MEMKFNAIDHLCRVLEAELEGRPFDRSKAMEIAVWLGEEFPTIQNSIKLICQRIAETPAFAEQIS